MLFLASTATATEYFINTGGFCWTETNPNGSLVGTVVGEFVDVSYPFVFFSQRQTFSAIPPTGCSLKGWSLSDAYTTFSLLGRTSYTVTLTEAELSRNANPQGHVYLSPWFTWLKYKIVYVADGAAGRPVDEGPYLYTNRVTLARAKPTKTGYTFSTWKDDHGKTFVAGEIVGDAAGSVESCAGALFGAQTFAATNGIVKLTAQWRANEYAIVYHSNNGSQSTRSQSVKYDQSVTLDANTFTRPGYSFAGWATSESGAVVYQNGATFKYQQTSDLTLYAKWTAGTTRITYHSNDDSNQQETQDVTYDASVTLSSTLFTRRGYTLAGWATSANGEIVYSRDKNNLTFTFTTTSPRTLYAVWTPNTYKVHFHGNGADNMGNSEDQTLTYDTETQLTKNSFTKTGYTFKGWNTAVDGSGTPYADEAKVINLVAEGSVILYAQWTPKNFTIRFDETAGRVNPNAPMDDMHLTYGVATNLTKNTFIAPDGYSFGGWTNTINGTLRHYEDEARVSTDLLSAMENEVVTLYAQWKPNDYTVRFAGNGATSGSMANQTLTYDKSANLNDNLFARDGYAFDGWLDPDGTHYANQATVVNLAAEGVVTLTAQWKPNPYAVKFDSNTGSGSMDVTNFIYGIEYALPSNAFTKTGYTFAGWATNETKDVVAFKDGATVSNLTTKADTTNTLSAVWSPNKYTVAFDGDGDGTADEVERAMMPVANFVYDLEGALPSNAFTKIGHSFSGWATNETKDVVVFTDGATVSNVTVVADETVILSAVFGKKTYTIHFDANGEMLQPASVAFQNLLGLPEPPLSAVPFGCTFKGWSATKNGTTVLEGKQVKLDETFLTSLGQDVAGTDTITLYAIWESADADIRAALDLPSYSENQTFLLVANGWSVLTDSALSEKGSSCLKTPDWGNPTLDMSLTVPGVLTFSYKMAQGDQVTVSLADETIYDSASDSSFADNQWMTITVSVPFAPTNIKWQVTAWAGEGVFLDNFRWIPAGATTHPEPTENDRVTVSNVSIENGQFVLKFAGNATFDYELWTNANLSLPSWGVMETRNGEEEVIFKPQILPSHPQLFYKVRTIQKQP